MLQVWLLGQFELKLDGRRVVLSRHAAQSLLAYLVLSAGTPHRREKLAGLLWSDLPEENARRNLRQEVWRIRKALVSPTSPNTDYLISEEFTIAFNRDTPYWLDAEQLQRESEDPESLISSLSLYRGELLPGMYDDWISLEREHLQSVFENKMQLLLEKLIAVERWNSAVEWSERWIAQGQTPEPAYRALMVAHAAQGNRAQVAVDYQRCVEALRDDLGVEPSKDTRELHEKITSGENGEPQIASTLPTVFVQPAGTITFLFSDIEGSTKLLERLGDDYAVLLSDQRDLLRGLAEKYSGYEVDTQGDSFFFAFFRAADAVQFASEAQRALAAHKWPHDTSLRVRMGLHTGEPMLARTGYVGMDVHRAARIGASGHGGQVLLSQTTKALVENDLPGGTQLKDLGEHKLKDLRYPIHIIQLSIEGLPSDFPPLKSVSSGTEPPAPGEPPFKGLEFFDERDANLFYGREQLIAKLIEFLHPSPILSSVGMSNTVEVGRGARGEGARSEGRFLAVIVGASGSGKSSLVRAGVVPALRGGRGILPNRLYEDIYLLTPTAHPLEALATALTRDSDSVLAAATLIDDLGKDPRALHLWLRRRTTNDERPTSDDRPPSSVLRHALLVIDQFEELFTLCRDEFEREAFIDNLLTALSYGEDGNLTVMLTLRADFYAHLAQYPELRDAVAKHQEFIGPMTSDELRRAIEEPAKQGGWEFEPGLVELILRDVGDEPGALPLLSHALLETWKRRSGHTLTLKGYHDAGGVRGAIAQTAESVYQEFALEEQAIARDIFLRLTELGEGTEDTRRRATFHELMPRPEDAAAVRRVLTRLADARLITLHQDTAEVAHEALIREWPQLREWLNQDRDGLRLHRQITEAANEWFVLERDPGALYRGARLIQAREYADKNPYALNAQERLYLEASDEQEIRGLREKEERQKHELEQAQKLAETESRRAEEQRRGARRLRWFAAGLALLLLTALGAAWFAYSQRNVAEANFVRAERIRLASQAQIALDNGEGGDLPALLSLQSMKHGYSPEADASLLNALKRGFTKQIYGGHTDLLWAVDFSPNGERVVTASNDGTARLWDTQTGQEIGKFAPPVRIMTTAVFAPDGRHIFVGGTGDVAWLWDGETGQTVREFRGNTDGVFGAGFSSDGRLLVTADTPVARLWDVETGQQIREFAGHSATVSPAILSPDNRYVVSSSSDRTARLWDVQTGHELRRLDFDASVLGIGFAPDSKAWFTASGNIVQMWDVETGEELQRYIGHTDVTTWGAFTPDGKYLITGSADKTARMWDVASGKELRQFVGHTGGIFFLDISPDGEFLLTAGEDRTARLWDTNAEHEPRSLETRGPGDIFTASSVPASLSPDTQILVYGYDLQGARSALWNMQSGEPLYIPLEGVENYSNLSSFAFSPDNRLLSGGDGSGAMWLWESATGKKHVELSGHTAPVRSLLFSPDSRFLLSASEDNSARLWDAQTGEQLQQYPGHTSPLRTLAFSPDAKLVVTGSDDMTARLWDAQAGTILKQFVGHTAPLRGVAFSPDVKYVVTGGDDETARLWDTETGKELRQFIGHTGQISQVAFSPDGKYVLTGSADQTARLWDAQTGELVRNFVGHVTPVLYIGFADNGRTVVTGDSQNAYRWRASLDDVIAFTCEQLTRDLTEDERALYRITDTGPTCAP